MSGIATADRARGLHWIALCRSALRGAEVTEVEQWGRTRDALGRATRTGGGGDR